MANRYKKAAAKRSKPRKPSRAGWLRAALAMLAITASVYAAVWAGGRAWHRLLSLDVFSISSVQISGLRHVRNSDLVAFMGSLEGKSILAIDLDGLVRSLESHPWIMAASAKRELPDGIRLMLSERSPAAVAYNGRGRYLIDTQGVVLTPVEDDAWDHLPTIICTAHGPPGMTGGPPDEGLEMALDLLGRVRTDLTEVLAGAVVHLGADGVPYLNVDGSVVTVGRDGYEDKVRRLAEIMSDVHKRGVTPKKVDLRFPGKVIVDGGRSRES